MTRTLYAIPVALALLAGCTTESRPPEAAKVSDSDIEQAVKNRLQSDAALRASDIAVDADVDRKEVALTGTVYSQQARTRIVEAARNAQPGYTITDKIDVKPLDVPRDRYTEDMARDTRETARGTGEKLGDSIEDAWLHTKVKAKLAANDATDSLKINVDVEKNVVTLRGQVGSANEKREAGRVAGETEGVRRVNNLLTVGS